MTITMMARAEETTQNPTAPRNSYTRVAFASFIGTAVEFYDFYIFA